MIASEQSRWNDTTHGFRSVSTVKPPMIACAGIPSASTKASSRTSRRSEPHAATNVATAIATSTNVSSRLPNSIAACTSRAPCGVNDVDVQRGQVGQPRPEPVSRTAPPVTTSTTLATNVAHASGRSHRASAEVTPT